MLCYKVIRYCSQEVVQLTIADRYIMRKYIKSLIGIQDSPLLSVILN